jgi:MFS family permease
METLDSRPAWIRLSISLVLATIGGVGFWSAVVSLPAIQADFGIARSEASLPYTLTMIGFAFGGVFMGNLADRFGIATPLALGAALLGVGYIRAGLSPNATLLALDQGVLIGVGASAFLSPLLADISHWFRKRRALAVTICSSGNYVAGVVWPPTLQHFIATDGWRATHVGVGVFCLLATGPLIWLLRARHPGGAPSATKPTHAHGDLALPPRVLVVLLSVAGLACCVAMSMPQAHLVAYCADLGYGPARGAEMLSAMLGLGIISRVGSGFVADRIGGLMTLMIGSLAQGLALFLYLWFDSLVSLYLISAIFGLFQGGIVPMYTVIVREHFPPSRAGSTVGIVMMATLVGMALGGWMSGVVYDLSGSYRMAFLNGLAWNLVNLGIVSFLLQRARARMAVA